MELKTFQPIYRLLNFGIWEKMVAHLRKIFSKIPINTRGLVYADALIDYEGWLENVFQLEYFYGA